MPYSFPTSDDFNALVERMVAVEAEVCPSSPTNLTATLIAANRVQLDWDDNPEAGVRYRGYRGGSHLFSGAPGSSAVDDPGPGTFTYWVTAYFASVDSPGSNHVTITVP